VRIGSYAQHSRLCPLAHEFGVHDGILWWCLLEWLACSRWPMLALTLNPWKSVILKSFFARRLVSMSFFTLGWSYSGGSTR
jgi:hypothetical protein